MPAIRARAGSVEGAIVASKAFLRRNNGPAWPSSTDTILTALTLRSSPRSTRERPYESFSKRETRPMRRTCEPTMSSRSHDRRTRPTCLPSARASQVYEYVSSFMEGSPCTTNSRLLAARPSSASEALSAPAAHHADTTAPASRPTAAAQNQRFHTARRVQYRATATHSTKATGIAHSGPTAGASFPSSTSAATLSTKAQLAHNPAHNAIVHGMRGRGGITCSRSDALIRRCNL